MRVELRDIEIFLVLAEELHFGRTAGRLHVSHNRVSQAIKAQERRIGAPLFDRTRRRVRLTPLGRQLRDDVRPAYAGLRDTLERAHVAARGVTAVLRAGMIPGNAHDLRAYWQTWRGGWIVSVGEVVNSLPAHAARYWSRPDVAWVPRPLAQTVRDLGPLHLGLS